MNKQRASSVRVATVIAFVTLLSACVAERSQERRDPAELFAAADTNGDSVVTRAELLTARASAFSKYDRNGDIAEVERGEEWRARRIRTPDLVVRRENAYSGA